MSNNLKNINGTKNKISTSNLIYLIGLVAITIIFLVIIIFIVVKPGTIKNFDDLNHIRVSEYNTLGSDKNNEYLIFVYSSKKNDNYEFSTYRNGFVKNAVISYANYQKENGGKKIYAIDISKDENSNAITTFKLDDETYVPALIVMKYSNGTSTINQTKKVTDDINTYLEGLMK